MRASGLNDAVAAAASAEGLAAGRADLAPAVGVLATALDDKRRHAAKALRAA
jgi:hypothetical protein